MSHFGFYHYTFPAFTSLLPTDSLTLKGDISDTGMGSVNSVEFSPDGSKIIGGGISSDYSSGTIKVWDSGAFWAKIPKFEPLLTVSASKHSYTESPDREEERPQPFRHLRALLARWKQNCVWQLRQDDQSLGFPAFCRV